MVISEYYIKGTFNWGVMSVASTIVCADCLYMGIKFKKGWRVLFGILSALFAVSMIIMFFNQLVAK